MQWLLTHMTGLSEGALVACMQNYKEGATYARLMSHKPVTANWSMTNKRTTTEIELRLWVKDSQTWHQGRNLFHIWSDTVDGSLQAETTTDLRIVLSVQPMYMTTCLSVQLSQFLWPSPHLDWHAAVYHSALIRGIVPFVFFFTLDLSPADFRIRTRYSLSMGHNHCVTRRDIGWRALNMVDADSVISHIVESVASHFYLATNWIHNSKRKQCSAWRVCIATTTLSLNTLRSISGVVSAKQRPAVGRHGSFITPVLFPASMSSSC